MQGGPAPGRADGRRSPDPGACGAPGAGGWGLGGWLLSAHLLFLCAGAVGVYITRNTRGLSTRLSETAFYLVLYRLLHRILS